METALRTVLVFIAYSSFLCAWRRSTPWTIRQDALRLAGKFRNFTVPRRLAKLSVRREIVKKPGCAFDGDLQTHLRTRAHVCTVHRPRPRLQPRCAQPAPGCNACSRLVRAPATDLCTTARHCARSLHSRSSAPRPDLHELRQTLHREQECGVRAAGGLQYLRKVAISEWGKLVESRAEHRPIGAPALLLTLVPLAHDQLQILQQHLRWSAHRFG